MLYKKVELSNIDNIKSFDDAEAWFDSIHSIHNIAQNY